MTCQCREHKLLCLLFCSLKPHKVQFVAYRVMQLAIPCGEDQDKPWWCSNSIIINGCNPRITMASFFLNIPIHQNGSSFYNYVLPIISDQNSSNSLIILHFYSYVFFILEYKVDRGKEGLRRLEQEIEKFT